VAPEPHRDLDKYRDDRLPTKLRPNVSRLPSMGE
jgi:hypothetical protein